MSSPENNDQNTRHSQANDGHPERSTDSDNSSQGADELGTDLNVTAPQVRHVDFPYNEEKTLLNVRTYASRRVSEVADGSFVFVRTRIWAVFAFHHVLVL